MFHIGFVCAGIGVMDTVLIVSITPIVIAVVSVLIGLLRVLIAENFNSFFSRSSSNNNQKHHQHQQRQPLPTEALSMDQSESRQAYRRRKIKEQHSFFLLMFSYMIMPPCLLAQLQALSCLPRIGIENIRYLKMDTSIDCDSSKYQEFIAIDILFVLLYMSIPLIWVFELWKYRRHLYPLGIEDEEMIADIRAKDQDLSHLHFLFSSYTSRATYW